MLQALFGFGRSTQLHRHRVLQDDQSLVVEIVDGEDRLRAFAATLHDVPDTGLTTLEAVEIIGG